MIQGDNTKMSNRWRQALYRKLDEKQNKIEEKQELTHSDVMAKEDIKGIRESLDDTPLLRDEEFERFEQKIEDINTEEI